MSQREFAQAQPFLERITDAFIALDRDWRIVYMNSAAMGLNAKPRPDVIGRSHWEEWPHTVGSEVERQYRLAMETQKPVHFEHHYRVPGHDYWHSIHAYPDANGLSIFYRDITDEKRTEELARLLATAGSQFAGTLDQRSTLRIVAEMPLPLLGQWSCVYLVDELWQVTDVRCAAVDDQQLALLRRVVAQLPISAADTRIPFNRPMHTGEAVLVSPVDAAFYDTFADEALRDFMRALEPQSILVVALVARGRTIGGMTLGTSQGNRVHGEFDVQAAREVALPAAMALDSARLFEAERQARRDAEDARKRAEHANRSKAEFLRAMSHELRTPLNAVGGYAQLLRMGLRGEVTEPQRADLERIERNVAHVNRLLADVLSFARLEAGRMEIDSRRVLVKNLLEELDAFVAPQATQGGHHLAIRTCGEEVAVWADPAKLMQILVNLVGNALKHTPAGTTIEVFCDSDAVEAHIRVRDNGAGIARELQQTIFEPFVQIGRQLNRPVEGLGLGLAIARDLAREMSGELTVESAPGQGATFTLSLPRR